MASVLKGRSLASLSSELVAVPRHADRNVASLAGGPEASDLVDVRLTLMANQRPVCHLAASPSVKAASAYFLLKQNIYILRPGVLAHGLLRPCSGPTVHTHYND